MPGSSRWSAPIIHDAPAEYYDLYDPAQMPLPEGGIPDHAEIRALAGFFDYHNHFTEETMREAIAAYYGLVSFLDNCIGRIMAALEATASPSDTLVIYTSDHGELLGEHGMWTKQVMYEASAGIPLILNGPGIPQGHNTASGAHFLDIASTAISLGGIDQPDHWPGTDLMALANADEDRSRTLFSNTTMAVQPPVLSWWHGMAWKLIWYAGRQPQLFNLDEDLGETRDRAADPAAVEALAEGRRRLLAICNPDKVSALAFADQRALIEAVGGEEACRNAFVFNATPTRSSRRPWKVKRKSSAGRARSGPGARSSAYAHRVRRKGIRHGHRR